MRFQADFAASRLEYEDGTVSTKCDFCRNDYRERNERGIPGDPPCEKCRVELKTENEEAARIFLLTRSQVIVGFNQVIDINHLAIHSNMDLYGIRDKRNCFEKVIKVFQKLKEEKGDS